MSIKLELMMEPLLSRIASQKGHTETCQALLSSGANVNQATTDNGTTPLWIASLKWTHRNMSSSFKLRSKCQSSYN